MIPIVTANILFFQPMHLYQFTPEYNLDVVLIGETNHRLSYIAIDRATENVVARHAIPYRSATTRAFKPYFPSLYQTDLTLENAFGIYRIFNDDVLVTFFIVQKHPGSKKYFLAQCNMKNHDLRTIEYLGIINHTNTTNSFLDIMIRKSSVYTDTKSISEYDAYIMIKGTNERNTNCVEGIRVLITDSEKSEYEKSHNLSFIETIYPVVDQWTGRNFRFYDFPGKVIDHSFSFSTGMGVLRFENEE